MASAPNPGCQMQEEDRVAVRHLKLWYHNLGGFPKLGVTFWGPNNKDYSIWGSMLGSPYFGKLPYRYIGNSRVSRL